MMYGFILFIYLFIYLFIFLGGDLFVMYPQLSHGEGYSVIKI